MEARQKLFVSHERAIEKVRVGAIISSSKCITWLIFADSMYIGSELARLVAAVNKRSSCFTTLGLTEQCKIIQRLMFLKCSTT